MQEIDINEVLPKQTDSQGLVHAICFKWHIHYPSTSLRNTGIFRPPHSFLVMISALQSIAVVHITYDNEHPDCEIS